MHAMHAMRALPYTSVAAAHPHCVEVLAGRGSCRWAAAASMVSGIGSLANWSTIHACLWSPDCPSLPTAGPGSSWPSVGTESEPGNGLPRSVTPPHPGAFAGGYAGAAPGHPGTPPLSMYGAFWPCQMHCRTSLYTQLSCATMRCGCGGAAFHTHGGLFVQGPSVPGECVPGTGHDAAGKAAVCVSL